MRKKIILTATIAGVLLGSIYGAGVGLSILAENRANSVIKNIINLDLSSVYALMDKDVKEKYKTVEEFIETFPLEDTMYPTNQEVFLQKSVDSGEAQYSYFLPNQDNVEEGHRVTVVMAYSLFDRSVRDILVQEDTAPIE